MRVDDVIFRKDLYPRFEHSTQTVQQYAADLDVLPPIEVNQHNELIDGRHRWLAHKSKESEEVSAIVTETTSDAQLLELAIARNNKHGLQLSTSDKKDMARKIYNSTPDSDQNAKKVELATLLSVTDRTIRGWLERIDKDNTAARKKRIQKLWEACYTEQEVADMEGIPQQTVNDIFKSITEKGKSSDFGITAENFEDRMGRPPPIYNVWKVQNKSNTTNHYGNTETAWVENLIYHYARPGQVVVDPFAGGGSTIKACSKFGCRYWVGDRKPIVGEQDKVAGIRQHDIVTDGLPNMRGKWNEVDLVYLDPPYWRQAQGQYSEDPSDLANMSLEAFHNEMVKIVNGFLSKLSRGAVVAMILQPTQWKADDRMYTDHIIDICKKVKHRIDMRIQAPYESQQCNAQMVNWAKENKTLLVLSREIVVWVKS